ncbi:MAG: hypothetical protein A2328_05235 [Bdellovibrionales bacterium RIFOXYB2_FULL_36_6]|nr:MAG: hypothetical protein A2328_05235 [Bdellovibrionales bacterium RIFOXYB2_FULL_36_6]
MYKWVETNSDYIFKSESKAKVLVVYSGRNRDLVDGYKSGGVYATPYGDGLLQGWTVNSFKESVKSMDYLAEHRGYVEMLIKLCIPFDMAELSSLPARVDLDKYKLMVLPEALSMSELETQKILSFIENGGNLYISGKDTGKLNQWGVSVSSCVFKEMKKKTSGFEDSWLVKEKGKYYFAGENSGKKFLNKKDKSIIKAFARKAKEIDVLPVAQNNSSLYVQVYEYNGKYIVSLVNYAWAGTKDKKVKSVEANISLPLPDGYTAGKVYAAYPENEGIEELKFVQEGNVVKVSAIVSINALIVISR